VVVLGNVYRMHICIPIHRFTLNRHTHARTRTCILAWKLYVCNNMAHVLSPWWPRRCPFHLEVRLTHHEKHSLIYLVN